MKEIPVEDISADADGLAAKLRTGGTVLRHHGTPLALVLSLDLYDSEDMNYMRSPGFWKMIDERRKQATIPWEQAKQELFGEESSQQH